MTLDSLTYQVFSPFHLLGGILSRTFLPAPNWVAVLCTPGPHVIPLCQTFCFSEPMWPFGSAPPLVLQYFPNKGYMGGDIFLGSACWFHQDTTLEIISLQSRFDARYWMLGAGALGRPRGIVRGGRREGSSGWGTRVYLRRIHVDILQNQYNIVKLKNKI